MANEINLKIARSSESHSHLCYGTPLPVFPLIDATQALTCSESSMFIFTLLLQPHIHTHTKTKKNWPGKFKYTLKNHETEDENFANSDIVFHVPKLPLQL